MTLMKCNARVHDTAIATKCTWCTVGVNTITNHNCSSLGCHISKFITFISIWEKPFFHGTCSSIQIQTKLILLTIPSHFDCSHGKYTFQIRVVLGGQGKTLAYLEFDGSGSSFINWFSKSRLLHSSWYDLKPNSRTNFFSIAGYVYVSGVLFYQIFSYIRAWTATLKRQHTSGSVYPSSYWKVFRREALQFTSSWMFKIDFYICMYILFSWLSENLVVTIAVLFVTKYF